MCHQLLHCRDPTAHSLSPSGSSGYLSGAAGKCCPLPLSSPWRSAGSHLISRRCWQGAPGRQRSLSRGTEETNRAGGAGAERLGHAISFPVNTVKDIYSIRAASSLTLLIGGLWLLAGRGRRLTACLKTDFFPPRCGHWRLEKGKWLLQRRKYLRGQSVNENMLYSSSKCNTSRDICECSQSHAKLIGNVTNKWCFIGANPRIISPYWGWKHRQAKLSRE